MRHHVSRLPTLCLIQLLHRPQHVFPASPAESSSLTWSRLLMRSLLEHQMLRFTAWGRQPKIQVFWDLKLIHLRGGDSLSKRMQN